MWAVVFKNNVVFSSESGERVVQERDSFYGDPVRHSTAILKLWAEDELKRAGIYKVQDVIPEYNSATHKAVRMEPIYDPGLRGVRFNYQVVEITQEELARSAREIKQRLFRDRYNKFVESISPDGTVEGALFRVMVALITDDLQEIGELRDILHAQEGE